MVFVCQQCGECCSHLGLVYSIIESNHDNSFKLLNRYTNVVYDVRIDPDKRDLFSDTTIFKTRPEACPFFRMDTGKNIAFCTIHETRPDVCQEYCCYRLRIENNQGIRVGRIINQRTLLSENALLTDIWEKHIATLRESDDAVWQRSMIQMLRTAGFLVI